MAVQESRLVISIDARNAERTAKALNSELQGITNNGNKAVSQTNALGGAMQSLAGYMAGVVTVGAAINKMDAYTNLQNRLKLVTNSQQELNQAMNDTFRIAQSSYQTWDSVVQVYQRFSDNAKTLGINMEQTAKLTETVSKAVAVSGASTQAAEAALTQFGQALASGALRGEELNSILEQTPALAKAIAQGMGITVGQLRSVAAEGKITGEVLVDALTKSADSVEELFAKTDITIGQSIGLLSNELTKFIGEAGQSSGAANLLAGSIKLLSENLSLLADAAVVGGIGYVTKAILTKTVAVQGAIAASVAQKAAATAEAQASIAVATAKVNEARAHLANVQATNAETQAKYGAAAANARYKLASDAVTQALIAQTAAQGALNSSVTIGSRALALVGGPIGAITLGVGALAAGYMYLQSRTAEANAKLEEQGEIANKTNAELEKLAGNDKVSAVNDLTAAFNSQNEALSKSKESVDAVLFAIRASAVENERARKITEDARNGVISYTDAIKLLNNEKISVDLYNKLKDQADQYDQNSIKAANTQRALAALKVEVKLAGNASQNAAWQHREQEAALNGVEGAAHGAANALSEYTTQALQAGKRAQITDTLLSKGYSLDVARDLADIAAKNGKVTREEAAAILYKSKQEESLKANIQARSKVESATSKARSSAAKQRAKEVKAATRDAERAAQERLQIEYQYADDLKKGYLDLDAEIKRIMESGADSSFIQKAKDSHKFEEELYLRSLTEQINAYKWSEEEKLNYSIETQKLIANESGKYNDDIKKIVLDNLDAQRDYELAQIQLAKETRIFQAQQSIYSEMELIKKRYELERRNIELTVKDLQERKALLDASTINQSRDEAGVRDQAISDYRGVMGYGENPLIKQFEVLQKMRELDLLSEEAYQNAKLELQAKSTASYMEGMLGGFAALVDENSKTYAALFAAQKAFAVAQAMLNIPAAYSKAYDAVVGTPFVGPYIAPAVGAAAAALQVAQAASIKSVNMSGFKSGGYTGNVGVNDVAGVVHGQEYVLNAEATKRVGRGTLDALNNGGTLESGGGVNVIINVPQGYKAVQTQTENGVTIDIVENMINQSWGNVSRPNSNESRAIQGAFGIAPKR